MNNYEKLVHSFSQTLDIDAGEVNDALSYGNHPWDSIAHMAIIAAIETAFDIMLDTDDVIDMSSFAKAKEIVAKYDVDLQS